MRALYPGLAAAAMLASLLTACGFHLRRPPELPAQMRAIYISDATDYINANINGGTDETPVLVRNLRRDLETGSSQVVDDPTLATALLNIARVNQYSTLLAINNKGVPLEYKVVYQVEFSLQVGNVMLIEPQTLVLSRTYNYNIADAIGNQEQEQGLYASMAGDMAQLITFRIEAAAKAAMQPPAVRPAPAPAMATRTPGT